MKAKHKVHRSKHKTEDSVHKKCRRKEKKEKNRERSRSCDVRSKSRSDSRPRYFDRSPSTSRGRHRARSRSTSRSKYRAKSRSSSQSRIRHRSRSSSKAKFTYRSRSRSGSRHRLKRSSSRSPKQDRNRAKDRPLERSSHNRRDNGVDNEENRTYDRDNQIVVKKEPSGEENLHGRNSRGRANERPQWGKKDDADNKKPKENNAKPDFGLSGKLAEEVNTYKGVVIKYSEPPEARMPKRRWRLYPFKGDEALPTLYIHRQSAYLIGRDRIVVDLPVDHPSCSKQHAVLQYRVVPYTRENGTKGNRIRPYIIDLDSANGTYVNNRRIESRKYVELLEKDVIKFAFSSREYVVLHEHSKDDDEDDNVTLNDV